VRLVVRFANWDKQVERQRTYDDLTQRQKWALQALMAEIARLAIAETIVECIRLRWLGRGGDEAKAEYRRALAGGRAAHLVMSYLRSLEDINRRRHELGTTISEKLNQPFPTTKEEARVYVEAELDAMVLAGLQEILLLDFASTCIQLYSLVQKAAEAAGYEIPPKDLEFLNHYRPLRDYSAHIYNWLPGGPNAEEVVTEIDDERGWQIIIGFEIDHRARVVLGNKLIEVNDRGLERVSEIVRRTLGALAPAAMVGIHRYFVEHPENIPPPSVVRNITLNRAARPGERSSRKASGERSKS
jgi:hypothetical protein